MTLTEEEKIAKFTGIKDKITQIQRLEYEKAYIKKYEPLFNADKFWLQELKYVHWSSVELSPNLRKLGEDRIFNKMQEYLKDYSRAYGRMPEWYQYDVYHDNPRTNVSKMNIKSFMEVMRGYWGDNGFDAVGIPVDVM